MLTIVWDVDDVLNDLTREWFERAWLPANPACRLSYLDLTDNPPYSLLKVSLDEYLASLDAFRLANQMKDLSPVGEARKWFEQYGSKYRHIALTAVPLQCASASAGWVITHFGQWIRSFHFIPSRRTGESLPTYDLDKADFLRSWFAEAVLVDDREENVSAAREGGFRAWLMPRPWNSSNQNISDTFGELSRL